MMTNTVAVVDTTVLIHLLRGDPIAAQWLSAQPRLSITPLSWLEVIQGAPGKRGQTRSLNLFSQFDMIYLARRWSGHETLLSLLDTLRDLKMYIQGS
jgi:predicted nucleic acid-binding protein